MEPEAGKVGLSLCFYLYVYVCVSVSHQDRLDDMKCPFICMHSLQEALFIGAESPPSNYYIGGSTCMTSMYRVHMYAYLKIRLDHYKEQFRGMTHTSPGLGYGRVPLMTYIM